MPNDDVIIEMWTKALKTTMILANKKMDCGLDNFEVTMYAQICSALEQYFKMQSILLGKAVDKIKEDLEAKANEAEGRDSDSGYS